MPTYRVYSVTSDGHIVGPATVVACKNDQEAISRAQQLKNGHDLELWDHDRFITKIRSEEV
jgi:hypothetical protein